MRPYVPELPIRLPLELTETNVKILSLFYLDHETITLAESISTLKVPTINIWGSRCHSALLRGNTTGNKILKGYKACAQVYILILLSGPPNEERSPSRTKIAI